MKVLLLILTNMLWFLCVNCNANERYTGTAHSTIVEPNGHVYMGDSGFNNDAVFENKQVIYFSQERGQKLTMTNQNIVFDTSRNKKYHLILEIIERIGEKFTAKVSFYQNAMADVGSSPTVQGNSALISKVIKSAEIEGHLDSDNHYTFIDENKANLNLSINIDRIFSEVEIKERLLKQLKNKRISEIN